MHRDTFIFRIAMLMSEMRKQKDAYQEVQQHRSAGPRKHNRNHIAWKGAEGKQLRHKLHRVLNRAVVAMNKQNGFVATLCALCVLHSGPCSPANHVACTELAQREPRSVLHV